MKSADLIAQWRADAELLGRYNQGLAAMAREHATALEDALRSEANDVLTLDEAARVSGFSKDRLRHRIAAGELENAGRKGAPRIRRGDLPTKARRRNGGAFDAASIARTIIEKAS